MLRNTRGNQLAFGTIQLEARKFIKLLLSRVNGHDGVFCALGKNEQIICKTQVSKTNPMASWMVFEKFPAQLLSLEVGITPALQ